jgi:HEAT repeat protein
MYHWSNEMKTTKSPQKIDHSQVLILVEKEDTEALIAVVKTSQNAAVLKHAILFLGGHKEIKAAVALIRCLSSKYESVSDYSVMALCQIGQPAVVHLIEALLLSLQDGDQTLADKIIKVLGQIGQSAKAATPALLKILGTTGDKDDPACNLRESVLTALSLIKDPDAVEPLIKFIKYDTSHGDDDYAFLNWIIFALGDIGDKRATKPLIRLMLRNVESRVRGTAAAALGKIGDNQAIEPLVGTLENNRENGFVRDNAAWALLQLDETKTALPILKYLKQNYQEKLDFLKGVPFPSEFERSTFHK